MVNFLNSGKALYAEGNDFARDHHQTDLFKFFACNYTSDAAETIKNVKGQAGTKVDQIQFTYSVSNDAGYSSDVIETNGGKTLFCCQNNHSRTVFYDGNQQYRTICSTFVFGALKDGSGKNKKSELMKIYLEYLLASSPVKNEPEYYELPCEFKLYQNFPNPFNSVTTISYELPSGRMTKIRLSIHNLLGQEIKCLVDEEQTGGTYHVSWDGTAANQMIIPGGCYLYRLMEGSYCFTKKILVIR